LNIIIFIWLLGYNSIQNAGFTV